MSLVYLKNYGTGKDAKEAGRKFLGDKELEKSLKERGVIGDGEETVKEVDVDDLTGKLVKADEEIVALKGIIDSNKKTINELQANDGGNNADLQAKVDTAETVAQEASAKLADLQAKVDSIDLTKNASDTKKAIEEIQTKA